MAVDTTSKRRSSVQILANYILAPPQPTGSISIFDRHHIAWTYSGFDYYSVVEEGCLPLWVAALDSTWLDKVEPSDYIAPRTTPTPSGYVYPN